MHIVLDGGVLLTGVFYYRDTLVITISEDKLLLYEYLLPFVVLYNRIDRNLERGKQILNRHRFGTLPAWLN